jgi:tetratricopeptide (TPR) repeat protein
MSVRPLWIVNLALVLATLFGSSISAAQPARQAVPGAGKLSSAEKAIRADDPVLAESEFRAAAAEALLALGNLAISQRRWDFAFRAFDQVTLNLTDPSEASLNMASVLLQQQKAEQAEAVLRQLLADRGPDPRVGQMLAAAYAGQGRIGEALQQISDVEKRLPNDPPVIYSHASIALRAGKFEEARALFDRLEKLRPGAAVHVLVGRTLRDFQRLDEAESELRKALEIDPRATRAHYYLGTLILLRNQFERMDEAISLFHREVELSPRDYLANLHLGIAYVFTKRAAEAIPPLERASASTAEPEPLYHLGQARYQIGDYSGAVIGLEKFLRSVDASGGKHANLSSAHYVLAQALRATGRDAEANDHFERARLLRQESVSTSQEKLSNYLSETGSEKVGSGTWQLAVAPMPPSTEVEAVQKQLIEIIANSYFNLGVLLAKKARFRAAATEFYYTQQWDSDYPNVDLSLGAARFNAGQFSMAVVPLERVVTKERSNLEASRMLALACFQSGQYARAAQLLERDPSLRTDHNLQYTLALALVRSGNSERAQEVFSYMLGHNATSAEVHLLLGNANAEQQQYDEALAEYKKALELDPKLKSAHLSSALILIRRAELAAARSELEKELELDPSDASARYHLAYVLDLQGDKRRAAEHLRQVLRATPGSADAHYLLGKILFNGGDLKSAAEELESAVRLTPDVSRYRYQLAQVLQRLGRASEAETEYAKFRELKAKEKPNADQ